MLKIDAHQHFWLYNPLRDQWIDNDMSILQNDFMPEHLQPILEHYGFQGTVVVQSDQSPEENLFQLKNAEQFDFIKGVVGWVDLLSEDLPQQLSEYLRFKKLKGFRSMLQSEEDRSSMLKPMFKRGISLLQQYGYTFDLVVLPDQLAYAHELVAAFPEQRFVLDHIGKPNIKLRLFEDWVKDIRALASQEHVYCKPYLDVIFESFGINRIMFGSDWPVCRLAATYGEVMGILEGYTSGFSKAEQDLFWGGNAMKFYNISA
jgi:L-fuconolactonase